jgi:GDP-D-mannose dehydratase
MSVTQFILDQPETEFTASGGSTVRRTVLPSGVRVLTEVVPGAQSASVAFSVAVGSRDEVDGHHGSTHFLEHLLFKGTKTRTALDIAVAFDSIGISNWESYVETDSDLKRSSDVKSVQIDPSLALSELGWRTNTPVSDWMSEMVTYHTEKLAQGSQS